MIQTLKEERPELSNLNPTQNRRIYINFENDSHFICSLNLNYPELTVFIAFKMTNIASGNQEFVNILVGNANGKINAKHITFYRTYSGLGLLISQAHGSAYIATANGSSASIPKPDLKFPSSKSNCTDLNKWHVISVTWSDKGENLSNCLSNGEKLISFTTENVKGSDHCYIGNFGRMLDWKKYIGDFGIMPGWNETYLTGCIGEIIAFHKTLKEQETLYIHEYLMKKWGITNTIVS